MNAAVECNPCQSKGRREHNDSWNGNDVQGGCLLGGLGLGLSLAVARCRLWLVVCLILVGVCVIKPILVMYAGSMALTRHIRTPAVLNPYMHFSGARDFEAHHALIQAEVATIRVEGMPLTKSTFAGQNNTIGSDVRWEAEHDVGWRVLVVSIGSQIADNVRQRCPTLVALLGRYADQVMSCAISVLPPRTRIPPHIGYYKGVMRYMLAVDIPKRRDDVYICVNGEKQLWTEGKSLMFDDCFEHQVNNGTDEQRVVLYMDIVRPLGGPVFDRLNRGFIWLMQNSSVAKAEVRRTETLVGL